MTLTPAIKEALDRYEYVVEERRAFWGDGQNDFKSPEEADKALENARAALLSVVAAEEGRKQLQATQNCPDCVYCSVHRQRGDTVV